MKSSNSLGDVEKPLLYECPHVCCLSRVLCIEYKEDFEADVDCLHQRVHLIDHILIEEEDLLGRQDSVTKRRGFEVAQSYLTSATPLISSLGRQQGMSHAGISKEHRV